MNVLEPPNSVHPPLQRAPLHTRISTRRHKQAIFVHVISKPGRTSLPTLLGPLEQGPPAGLCLREEVAVHRHVFHVDVQQRHLLEALPIRVIHPPRGLNHGVHHGVHPGALHDAAVVGVLNHGGCSKGRVREPQRCPTGGHALGHALPAPSSLKLMKEWNPRYLSLSQNMI